MDEWIYRLMDRQMDGQIGGWIDRWMDMQMKGYIDGWLDRWMVRQMDGQIDGWLDSWIEKTQMEGWIYVDYRWLNAQIDGCIDE